MSIIARGTVASVAVKQASASIAANAASARTLFLRPTLRNDAKSGYKHKQSGMQAVRHGCSGEAGVWNNDDMW